MPQFITTSQAVLIYNKAKTFRNVRANSTYKSNFCVEELFDFHTIRKHRSSHNEIPIKICNLDKETLFEDINDTHIKEEPNFCIQNLVDSELDKGRHRVFNFVMSSFNNSFFNATLDLVYRQLKCAAKNNLAYRFVLKYNKE